MAKVKSQAQIAVTQVAPQRKTKNTRFGEIIRINAVTGESVADQIREDIFEGATSRLRRYLHYGEKYGTKYGVQTVGYFRFPNGTHSKAPLMPIVALKDDFLRGYQGREMPYEMLPWEDPRYKFKKKLLDKFGVDFPSMSRQMIGYIYPMNTPGWRGTYGKQYRSSPLIREKYPTEAEYFQFLIKLVNLPTYGSDHWNKYYGKSWKSNIKNCCKSRKPDGSCTGAFDNDPREEQKKFCTDYPTEKIYYKKLQKEKDEMWKKNDMISDIHFGLFATPKTLDEENNAALLYTLAPLLVKAQTFAVEVGSFVVDYKFKDWSLSRRMGVADPIRYPPARNPKIGHSSHEIYHGQRIAPAWTDGDPIDHSFASEHKGGVSSSVGTMAGRFMIELRVQDTPDASDNPRYICMRLYNPTSMLKVDTPKGQKGKGARKYIYGSLARFNSTDPKKPYTDALIYPLSYEAMRMVKIFKRERLLRETAIVVVSIMQQQKLKWYQSSWMKIIMIVVAVVITFISQGSLAKVAAALLKMALISVALTVLSKVIENKFLLAIIQAAIFLYIGYADTNSLMQNIALMVEATGTVYQGYVVEQMIKMEKEYADFRKKMNEKEEELKKLQREAGMNEQRREFVRYLATLPPYETADDYFERTMNQNLNESEYPETSLTLDVDA